MAVPIRYGSADRVVEAIGGDHTQNKLFTLPMMSCYMSGIELAPDRIHGLGGTDRRTFLEQGGVYPDDVKTVVRVVPIPYNLGVDLSIYASNSDQLYQILEQILLIFPGYDLQISFNDKFWDWTRVTTVNLLSIGNEEVVPTGTERRAIMMTLSFELPVWLSPPADVRDEIIRQITIRLGDLSSFTLDEVDDQGNLQPFIDPWGQTTITADPVHDPAEVTSVHVNISEHYDAGEDDCRC